jgi:L-histidine N-alpha-methyltransferase
MTASLQPIWIHPSQFPEALARARKQSLKTAVIDHSFHYLSERQSELWLALHQKYAPAQNDPQAAALYGDIVAKVQAELGAGTAHVVALGCGGGEKDLALVAELRKAGRRVRLTPVDGSVGLALHSAQAAEGKTDFMLRPLVADLRELTDLPGILEEFAPNETRIFTFYGLLPNFEPGEILPQLRSWLRPEDVLVLSANLAPALDETVESYLEAMQRILPQYQNPETLEWVGRVLVEWGMENEVAELGVSIEPLGGLYRFMIWTWWQGGGKPLQVFYSYRHTPERLRILLGDYGLALGPGMISASGEEGIWVVRRAELKQTLE